MLQRLGGITCNATPIAPREPMLWIRALLRLLYTGTAHIPLSLTIHLRLERGGELALLPLLIPGGGLRREKEEVRTAGRSVRWDDAYPFVCEARKGESRYN